jgi:acyl carrier protein
MDRMHQVNELLADAIRELNRQLPRKQQLGVDDGAPLFGPRSPLDSLGLVNLVVLLEQRVEERFGVELGLTTDALATGDPKALATVGAFRDLVVALLDERSHAAK